MECLLLWISFFQSNGFSVRCFQSSTLWNVLGLSLMIFLKRFLIYVSDFSLSSYRIASTHLPGPLSPPIPIVHRSQEVFKATSRIATELLNIGSSWSSCLCSSMWRGPHECIAYELLLTSPAVFCMSRSSNLDTFRDGW